MEIGREAMGPAALPRNSGNRVDGLPQPIDSEIEAQHPHWPTIRPLAPQAAGCAGIRQEYKRTRCVAPNCERCWGAQ